MLHTFLRNGQIEYATVHFKRAVATQQSIFLWNVSLSPNKFFTIYGPLL